MDFLRNLQGSLHMGFIDQKHNEFGTTFKPKLLINNAATNENVLSTILEELDHCKSFVFSVAFITESGLAMLKSHLLDLKRRGVSGRILTSTYLFFNNPKVFRELLKIENVEVKLTSLKGFHSKGYIFHHEMHYSLIVGSSNLTAQALKVNYEWNVKLTSHEDGEIIHHFQAQFQDVWDRAVPLTERWVDTYEETYRSVAFQQGTEQVIEFQGFDQPNAIEDALQIKPNRMQEAALIELQAVRDAGKDKGLIISATGTGKTYLAAFDVRRFAPKRMLFIVHREQILQQAKADFKRVLGGVDEDFGILSGTSREMSVKYVFATIQTISKAETMGQFDRQTFDYILIDEVHKAGAPSYLKVIDYFQPAFLIGMTATPERTDDFNIYELFDYNVAYEIRLQDALEADMLCPFHYFGVTELVMDGETIDDTTLLAKLVTDERVDHLIEKMDYYGFPGEQVKGLIFCCRKEEAGRLSFAMNTRGYKTVALTGDDSQEVRMQRVSELESGDLDYIITVDIFNEGIDIPTVNQVVMLRQTQSSIIFIQQLGRGLRKHQSKEFVTIIDFIGNYRNNYLIPIALSGDKSLNKDNVRRAMQDTSYIKGISTVNFEEIAKKQIFKAIDNTNLTQLKILKEAYNALKHRLGRIPALIDFLHCGSIDPVVIVQKYANYHAFLLKMKEEVPTLSEREEKVLSMLSQEVLPGKRKHEVILLELLLEQDRVPLAEYCQHLEEAHCAVDDATIASVERVFDLSFYTQVFQAKYGGEPIVTRDSANSYQISEDIRASLRSHEYFRQMVQDIIESARHKSKAYQPDTPFTLYAKYTRKDTCRLLNWHGDESSTMYGYKTKHGTCPIFITYHKHDVDASVAYGDEFLNQDVLRWYTRSQRTLHSAEVQTIVNAEAKGIDLHLFVKKDDDEGSDFYYVGKATPDKATVQQTVMQNAQGNDIPVVYMNLVCEHRLESKLYQYLKSDV